MQDAGDRRRRAPPGQPTLPLRPRRLAALFPFKAMETGGEISDVRVGRQGPL